MNQRPAIPFQMHLTNLLSAMKRAGINPDLLLEDWLEASCYAELLFSEAVIQRTIKKSLHEALLLLTASYIVETHYRNSATAKYFRPSKILVTGISCSLNLDYLFAGMTQKPFRSRLYKRENRSIRKDRLVLFHIQYFKHDVLEKTQYEFNLGV